MGQSSGPITGINFSDAMWRDILGDEAGVVGDLDGSSYKVALPTDSNIASVGSTTQDSVARVAGFSHRINKEDSEPVTIPAATSSPETSIIALKYDPSHSGLPGPVRLALIPGTTSALPTYDDAPPGIEYLPLWGITRNPGQALSQAALTRLYPRIAPSLDLPTGVPLPLSSPQGTIVRQGSVQYRRELGSGSVPVWVRWPSEGTWTNLTLNSPWVVVPGAGLPGAKYKVKNGDTHFSLRVTRPSGWTGPLPIFTFPPGARPAHAHYFRATKDNTDGIGSMMLTVYATGLAEINANGQAGNDIYVSDSFPNA